MRGLYAGADIAAGDVLLEVPRRGLLLPADAAAIADDVRVIAGGMADHVLLALLLLRTAVDPAWRPLHDMLPTVLPGHPLFWDAADLAWLDGTSLRRLVEDRRAVLGEELRALRRGGLVPTSLTDDDWLRVRTLVSSRAFELDGELPAPPGSGLALVPFADLMNHAPISQVTWGLERDRFVLRARVPIAAGQEVCDDYGPKGNGRLLLHYGFTLPENPHAECVVYPWVYGPLRVRLGHDEDREGVRAALREAPEGLAEIAAAACARLRGDEEGLLTENQRNARRVHADERRVWGWLVGGG
ncbi:MAG: SET domain-containing protein [Myxococcota bacterium]